MFLILWVEWIWVQLHVVQGEIGAENLAREDLYSGLTTVEHRAGRAPNRSRNFTESYTQFSHRQAAQAHSVLKIILP